ncbi:exopolyphosphatase [Pararhizobium mangrovi]|uniref:exopolyphosphatase n=1 Tax=Pararhizobium mangrovi TaxID=2590452 RepID=A0A506UG19_9HYPH|nr:exopolyphosphatase [Pararhizobium mangrovi]TPW32065.1 exopolyphosphatase [Pararhizobium mangrovi]
MIESEALGRISGFRPVSVIDIGSNSVRLVIYERLSRSPSILFNEKVLCGLGRGLVATNRMDDAGVERALSALKRFRALSRQAQAIEMHVIATAAAREAENGSEFIRRAEAILEAPIRVLSGKEEATYSAYGVISGFAAPDGIAGDLGGGSLELVDIRGSRIGDGVTLPLGGLRLADLAGGSVSKARAFARRQIKGAKFLAKGKNRLFYAVGGTWRNIARLHMEQTGYPLHMMHAYEIEFEPMMDFLSRVARLRDTGSCELKPVSKNRRALLPFGAVALQETIAAIRPRAVSISALGVREGYLFSLLDAEERARDPLLATAEELALLRARSPEHAYEIAEWTERVMPVFGVDESTDEARYRRAACLLADISWRAHPDYRGLQAVNIIAHNSFSGISHAGRAYLALVNYYRFEGLGDDSATEPLAKVAGERFVQLAKLVGGILRVGYLFSASMAGAVPLLRFEAVHDENDEADVVLIVPERLADLAGERVNGRLQQLGKLTGRRIGVRIEHD